AAAGRAGGRARGDLDADATPARARRRACRRRRRLRLLVRDHRHRPAPVRLGPAVRRDAGCPGVRIAAPATAGCRWGPVPQGRAELMDIDWASLRAAAESAAAHAYAPYSRYRVGAAGPVDDGRVVTGCNVENASYGLTLCAECGMVSALVDSGGGQLVAVSCVDGDGQPLMPCGRCRQLLWEHGGPDCLVDFVPAPLPMRELLPHAC